MALPTAATPGFTGYSNGGREWVACRCLAKWLDTYERLLLHHGLIHTSIDVWQLTGGATASAGTHSLGGTFDLLYQTSDECVRLAREMGAPATWRRPVTATSTWRKTHTHGVLSACVHNEPAAYQIAAQLLGRNGLGYRGLAGPDPHPRPAVYRTWEQGIAWAEKQMAPPPAPTTTPTQSEEDDMQLTDKVTLPVIEGVAYANRESNVGAVLTGGFGYTIQTRNRVDAHAAQARVRDEAILAAIKGVDTDKIIAAIEASSAANLVKIGEIVREAVPDEIADDVVAKIGAALNPPTP